MMLSAAVAIVAIIAWVGATAADSSNLVQAVVGLLAALTILVHTIIAERTRRQAKAIPRQVRRNTARLHAHEDASAVALQEKDEAIARLNDRVNRMMGVLEAFGLEEEAQRRRDPRRLR